MSDKLYTISEAAKLAGVSYAIVQCMIRRDELNPVETYGKSATPKLMLTKQQVKHIKSRKKMGNWGI